MKILKVIIFIIISSLFGANFDLDLLSLRNNKLNNSGRDNHDIHIIGIMVDFESDDDPKTTGDGQFLSESGSARERCVGDNFLVDPPPHNAAYFESQIEAVKNYYYNVSNGVFEIDFTMLGSNYSLQNNMSYYSVSDESIGQLFSDALDISKTDWEQVVGSGSLDDYLFVVFHAGVGQDISFPYFDPANYDIPSAFIEESMLASDWVSDSGISEGIVMPETLNHIYYDIVEDLFYGVEDYCDYQLGMTGLFSLLVGYALDFPVLYNTENGRAGVGVFGLMDYGSNNGFGVIPAPPSPWTKINQGWASSSYSSIGSNTLTDNIHRLDVANNEYLLVENRNNWVFPDTEVEVDIDSLRRRNKITNSSGDEVSGHFFDVIEDNLASIGKMTIDSNTGVITGFDSYDYGLPGSGILIWEINDTFDESEFIDGINNDPNDKGIQIKEADGAMDIGFECYYWNPAVCDIIVRGMADDMWRSENEAYFINNETQSDIIFNDYTYPNSRSSLGALSSIQLDSFGEIGTSMSYDYSLNPWVDIETISEENINILGSGISVYLDDFENYLGQGPPLTIYYSVGLNTYRMTPYVTELINDSEEYVSVLLYDNNRIFVTENDLVDGSDVYYDGTVLRSVNDIGIFGYIDNASTLKESSEGVALGDLDGDGLDEVVLVSDNSLDIQNSNGTSVDGFPISGNFDSTVLIANILNDSSPELIVRRGNVIDFIDNQGNLINSVASNSTQDLRLLPWTDGIALIDGSRMLLFSYDSDNTFWTSKYGNDWNSKTVDQFAVHTAASLNSGQYRFYNYPNPVRDGSTTFRFLYNTENMSPLIKLYDVQGTLKETIVPDVSFTYQSDDYNEISADFSGYKAGVYFAELKDGESSISIIKVAIIK